MNNILQYLTYPYAMFSVTLPWVFVVYWYISEGRKNPPSVTVLWHWIGLTVFTYFMTSWKITDDNVSLHMLDGFFFYLVLYLWLGFKITPGAAYTLSFIQMWAVDMSKAYELIDVGLSLPETYYYGVGGAGAFDGLCIFPLVSAMMVHYVAWRRK